jgi:predicted nucleic acid-binding Zn ribbon protein
MSKYQHYEPRSASKAKPLENAFREFLDRYKLNQKFDETYLVVYWEKIMGPTIAKRTTSLFVKNKVLFVTVSSAPLRQELQHSKEEILRLLAQEVGTGVIEEIVVR